jgi:hypothetical protein
MDGKYRYAGGRLTYRQNHLVLSTRASPLQTRTQ